MMRQTSKCAYHADAEVKLLELPCVGGQISMGVLLPMAGGLSHAT